MGDSEERPEARAASCLVELVHRLMAALVGLVLPLGQRMGLLHPYLPARQGPMVTVTAVRYVVPVAVTAAAVDLLILKAVLEMLYLWTASTPCPVEMQLPSQAPGVLPALLWEPRAMLQKVAVEPVLFPASVGVCVFVCWLGQQGRVWGEEDERIGQAGQPSVLMPAQA